MYDAIWSVLSIWSIAKSEAISKDSVPILCVVNRSIIAFCFNQFRGNVYFHIYCNIQSKT